MADLTMCCNCLCPIRKRCYRYRAVPDQYRQSWCNFQPKTVLKKNKYETECLHFWEVNEATDRTIPFDVVENRYESDEKMEGDKVKKCTCYTCTHDDPKELAAYYQGYIDACGWFLCWAKHQNIKKGSIADNDLGGIYAQIAYNCEESEYLLSEIKELIGQ